MPFRFSPRNITATGLVIASLAVLPAHADTLNGTTITGTLTSNSSGILVTKPFQSTASTVGGGVEFTGAVYNTYFQDYVTYNISADFSDTLFTLHVSSSDPNVNISSSGNLYTLQFTDAAFAGLQLPFAAYTCSGAFCYTYAQAQQYEVSSGISGNTFTASFKELRGNETFTFGPAVTVTPEPSSLILLSTGLFGSVAVLKRRGRKLLSS